MDGSCVEHQQLSLRSGNLEDHLHRLPLHIEEREWVLAQVLDERAADASPLRTRHLFHMDSETTHNVTAPHRLRESDEV